MLDEQFRAMSEEADREAMASARMLGYALLVTTLAFFSWIFWAVFA